jgi:hypothetical protein
LRHFASPDFWFHYRALPVEIQQLADKCFEFMKADPRHPSIHLKRVGEYWSDLAKRDFSEVMYYWDFG